VRKGIRNERILAIKIEYPVAPVHILIIPRKRFLSSSFTPEDLSLMTEIVEMLKAGCGI